MDLNDKMNEAKLCNCGSSRFHLLRDKLVECAKCQKQDWTMWFNKKKDNKMTNTTLELGHGDVAIAPLKADNGNHGILFQLNQGGAIGENNGRGECRSEDFEGCFLEITSTSPESIQVLIDRLEEAKGYF